MARNKLADFKVGSYWRDNVGGYPRSSIGIYRVVCVRKNQRGKYVITVRWVTDRDSEIETDYGLEMVDDDLPLSDAERADLVLSGEYT